MKPENRLRRARELAGLSLNQAAFILNVSPVLLDWMETDLAPPQGNNLRHMADVYGVSEAWLRGFESEISKSTEEMLRHSDLTFAEREYIRELLGSMASGVPSISDAPVGPRVF